VGGGTVEVGGDVTANGNGEDGLIATGDDFTQLQEILDDLKKRLGEFADADRAKLEDRIARLEVALAKPSRDHWFVRRVVTDIRNVLTGAGGNLAASGVIKLLNQVLGRGGGEVGPG
jgi:hypothetical protein